MRAEEKQLDGPELLLAEKKDRDELVEEDYDEMPVAGDERRDTGQDRRSALLGAMRSILEGRELEVGKLGLPARELAALETLQAAKTGRDPELDSFLYAEDREEMLEQALAILQTNLAGNAARELEDMRGAFDAVVAQVAELRRELHQLTDAEEEIIARAPAETKAEDESDDDDEDDDDDDGDRPKPPSSLLGPDMADTKKPASSLTGPDPTFEIVMAKAGGKDPIDALRELRDLTGIGLREGKELLESGGTLKRVADEREARELAKKLAAAGYTVEVREVAPA